MRMPLIAGNWKMHRAAAGTMTFFESFRPQVEYSEHREIVICPSFLDLEGAVAAARGSRIQIGAQNLCWAKEGAFTGEVSGSMIRAAGCTHVIVGHSERRKYFGETGESALKKTLEALDVGITPIVCLGEREKKSADAAIVEQFAHSIAPLSEAQFAGIVIAYEPLWAIGTGETASPRFANDSHRLIRECAKSSFGAAAGRNVRILYGGSVKPDNAKGAHGRAGDRWAPRGGRKPGSGHLCIHCKYLKLKLQRRVEPYLSI